MLNAVFLARSTPQEALAWYRDFRSNPATAAIDAEAGIEAMGYQCLKNGAVETAVRLLEANLAEHPDSADAHFGLGRAYRAAGREAEAVGEFQAALAIDPGHGRAAEALDQ
jgi:Tfp pilus assembly protein PilF